MHVLTDNEMQRFVRWSAGAGALLLVLGILGLGLWLVSLGGLLLVLAALVVLAAVEGRELDELPARADAPPARHAEPAAPSGVAAPSVPPAAATLSPLARLAMALPPAAPSHRPPLAMAPAADQPPAPHPERSPTLGEASGEARPTAAPVELAEQPPPGPLLGERSDPARPAAAPVEVAEPPEQVVDLRGDAARSSGAPTDGEPSSRPDGEEPAVVTFRLPRAVGARTAAVVGEFNGWSPDAHPMVLEGDAFVARIPLAPGRAYRFRYLLDGARWENDWAADRYVANGFGGDDSVVDLRSSAHGRQDTTASMSGTDRRSAGTPGAI